MKVLLSDYAVGAGLATDLVITSPAVSRTGDLLADPSVLAEFLAEHGLSPSALRDGEGPTGMDVDDVRALREEVRLVLETATEEGVVDAATSLVARAGTGPALCRDTEGHWQWCVTTAPDATLAAELAGVVGSGLLGVVRALSRERFRHCAADDCDGMFVDTSKAGRRRYCMPGVCGNRRNVANYRARLRQRS